MNTKRKIALSLCIVLLLSILAAVAVVAVLAATRQQVSSYIRISYTAMEVSGQASARWKVGNEDWKDMTTGGEADGATILTFGDEENENASLSPTDKEIKLTSQNDYVVFEYKFTNDGYNDYSIDLFYTDDEVEDNNVSVFCLNTSEEVTSSFEDKITTAYSDWTNTTISPEEGTKFVYILVSVMFKKLSASYSGSFQFKLDGTDFSSDLVFDGAGTITGLNNDDLSVLRIPSEINNIPVTTIAANAFTNKTNLTEVIIPDSVETINVAFKGCSNIKYMQVPFVGNTRTASSTPKSLFGYIFGATSTTEQGQIFPGEKNKPLNVIVTGGTIIGPSAFGTCYSLTNISIPSGITTIDVGSFMKCSRLKKIHFPSTVSKVGGNAFMDCLNSYSEIGLKTVTIAKDSELSQLGSGAFNNCRYLQSINLPDTITVLNTSTFYQCYALENVTIPAYLTEIGYEAFLGTNIKNITIPETVTKIEEKAFSGCSGLTSINIPSAVTKIGYNAFSCKNLTKVTIDSQTVCNNLVSWNSGNYTKTGLIEYATIIKSKYEIAKLTSHTFNGMQSDGYYLYTK